jgi:hypothetical protein
MHVDVYTTHSLLVAGYIMVLHFNFNEAIILNITEELWLMQKGHIFQSNGLA